MVKTNTPVIWGGKDCGRLINHYRYEANSVLEAYRMHLNTRTDKREKTEYVRVYSNRT